MFDIIKARKSLWIGLLLVMVISFTYFTISHAQLWSPTPPYNVLWPTWGPTLSPPTTSTGMAPLVTSLSNASALLGWADLGRDVIQTFVSGTSTHVPGFPIGRGVKTNSSTFSATQFASQLELGAMVPNLYSSPFISHVGQFSVGSDTTTLSEGYLPYSPYLPLYPYSPPPSLISLGGEFSRLLNFGGVSPIGPSFISLPSTITNEPYLYGTVGGVNAGQVPIRLPTPVGVLSIT